MDENTGRKKTIAIALLIILLSVSGITGIVFTVSIDNVDNGSVIIPVDKVNAEFVDENGNLMISGGFSNAANNGEGAGRISYTVSCVNGDIEKTRYNVKIQSLELGRAKLKVKTDGDLDVRYVRMWFDITWKTVNPIEEYGMIVKLGVNGTDVSLSEGEVSKIIEISKIDQHAFILTGKIPSVVSSPVKPDLIKYDIIIHVESF